MPCINSDGTLTEAAVTLMSVMVEHHSLEEVASITDIPLYLVRATARDLIDTRLATEQDGAYRITKLGSEKLAYTLAKLNAG
jgi:predicted transcriptional regulator